MADLGQFQQIVVSLLSPDNKLRPQAEVAFNEVCKHMPDNFALFLLQLARHSENQQIREFCIVMLRRHIMNKESLFTRLSPQVQATIKSELLTAVQVEQVLSLRKKLSNAIAELALHLHTANQEWNELLPLLFKMSKSPDPILRECGLVIFQNLAQLLGEVLVPYFGVLKQTFIEGLNDASLGVRIASLAAATAFLQSIFDPEERQQFQELTPLLLQVVSAALNSGQREAARLSIEFFVEIADVDPGFLRPHIAYVANAMLTVAAATQVDKNTRFMALEFLLVMAEKRPATMRKLPNFLQALVPIILTFLMDREDDPNWSTYDDTENEDSDNEEGLATEADEDEDSYFVFGEEAMDRLAIAIGGKALVPILFASANTMLNNNDWRQRQAALLAISVAAEGCSEFLTPHLDKVMELVLPRFDDPHPRVRYAMCDCVGQMSTDFAPIFQNRFHESVLGKGLLKLLDDAANPKVQSRAASAIVNFCDMCDAQVLLPYLDVIMQKFIHLLQTAPRGVQERVITAVSAIADCIEEEFRKYYGIVSVLKTIITNAVAKEQRKLRGKAIECIAVIGVAVGREMFAQDAQEVLAFLVQLNSVKMEHDDPQIKYIQQAWGRLCGVLGQDFVPFLKYIIPTLLEQAGSSPIVDSRGIPQGTAMSASGMMTIAENGGPIPEGWESLPFGDKRICINSEVAADKASACHMIYYYCAELKEGFIGYVQETAKIMVPLLKFYYNDSVRSAAASITGALMECVSLAAKKGMTDHTAPRMLLAYMLPTLLEALKSEMDIDIAILMAEGLFESIEYAGENALRPEQISEIVAALDGLLKEVAERISDRLVELRGEEDFDEEEEYRLAKANEKEEKLLVALGECVGRMAKHHHAPILPLLQPLLPTVLSFLDPKNDAIVRNVGLCICDDIIEHTNGAAFPLFEHVIPKMLAYALDDHAGVRQASAYGIGVCAMVGGDHFVKYLHECLVRLNQVITHPRANEANYRSPTENAVSSIGKIIMYQTAHVNVPNLLAFWFAQLPVTKDKIEAKIVYGQLCTFVEKYPQLLLGHNLQNLPKLLAIFGEVLETKLVNEQVTARIAGLLKQMQASIPGDILQRVFATLTEEQQRKLHKCVTSQNAPQIQ